MGKMKREYTWLKGKQMPCTYFGRYQKLVKENEVLKKSLTQVTNSPRFICSKNFDPFVTLNE